MSETLGNLGKVSLIALAVACGAQDNEVNAVIDRLAYLDIPEDREQIVAQMRATITEVRGG